jgi:hypothetical protein
MFGSPILLVKKEETAWHLIMDYRHLNALTVKGKYPDELLDDCLVDEKDSSSLFPGNAPCAW